MKLKNVSFIAVVYAVGKSTLLHMRIPTHMRAQNGLRILSIQQIRNEQVWWTKTPNWHIRHDKSYPDDIRAQYIYDKSWHGSWHGIDAAWWSMWWYRTMSMQAGSPKEDGEVWSCICIWVCFSLQVKQVMSMYSDLTTVNCKLIHSKRIVLPKLPQMTNTQRELSDSEIAVAPAGFLTQNVLLLCAMLLIVNKHLGLAK